MDSGLWIKNETLEGQHVTLVPLTEEHTDELIDAVKDGELWKIGYANVPPPEYMSAYVKAAINGAKAGNIAYAVRAKNTDQIVGTTRYYDVDAANRRAMIGYTWYGDAARRTPVNTEAKLLLLSTLFDACDAIAVEFRTHIANQVSRTAIERLGAKQDGILRHHQIWKDGSLRDTVVYSIIADEWPEVKANLLARLS